MNLINKHQRKYIALLTTVILLFLLFAVSVSAVQLPAGVQKLIEYSSQRAQYVSFLVAFLGGVLSVISPCVLPVLPAFFAVSFKEREEITKKTILFFFGMASVFVLLGVLSAITGALVFTAYRKQATLFVGIVLLLFGLLMILGGGFRFFSFSPKPSRTNFGIFGFGALFAVGFTPCIGAILTSILFIAGGSGNLVYGGLLLFAYALGFAIPLFLLAFFYDKYNLSEKAWIRGRSFEFTILGRKFETHTSKIAAGAILLFFGVLFILYRNTGIFNTIDPLGTKQFFYDLNNKVLDMKISRFAGNIVGAVLIAAFAVFAWRHFRKNSLKKRKE
ncbi:cytochrome c biogenesis protein CcdA [Candidatus Woesearchaeota archaeon]|nr:cytochrome c biogenesis protein CcdA [Candidatus Woesearchaeota archaeon]